MGPLAFAVGLFSALSAVPAADTPAVRTRWRQVYPLDGEDLTRWARGRGQSRAVVLLHGLRYQMFSDAAVSSATFSTWQQPGSELVKELAKSSDVYVFAYGQNVTLDEVAASPSLAQGFVRVRELGYEEIVLVGHSAGGLIGRFYVEDHPDCGVTRVVQVCSPNGGSDWSKVNFAIRRSQLPFINSLSKAGREASEKERAGRRLPDAVEVVTAVGTWGPGSDWVVACNSQWSEALQRQGVPAVAVRSSHLTVMRAKPGVTRVAELAREWQPRWSAHQVTAARQAILKLGGALDEGPELPESEP